MLKLKDFSFILPKNLIASKPKIPRDHSKMLVIDQNVMQDKYFYNLPETLNKNDLIIFNDSKVIPASLTVKKNDKTFNLNLHKQLNPNTWKIFVKKAKLIKIGDKLTICDEYHVEIIDKNGGEITIKFNCDNAIDIIRKYGSMPLPPYMKRQASQQDQHDYQTIYANKEGSVAAPTAGLHFTKDILLKLTEQGINYCFVTLHVGAGTFLPVKINDITKHEMHSEYFEIKQSVSNAIKAAKAKGGRVIAVGTTSLRSLEACADSKGIVKPFYGETDIFIYPGYKFKVVDMLLTNFHLPESTLFMLVCAFSGLEKIQKAYKHAICQKYRFFSYGDCCLLTRNQ